MIRAVIIDDELLAIENLRLLVDEFCPNVEIVGDASSVARGKEVIESCKPDLVFLDVEMPFGTGFDLLSSLKEIDFQVIFITAYNQYAIKAIKCSAIDYIMKPVDIDELKDAVDRAEKITNQSEQLKSLLDGVEYDEQKTLALAESGGYRIIELEAIIYCRADSNYTVFKLKDGSSITSAKTLKEYATMLPDYFFRVHHSYLANMNNVVKFVKSDGGSLEMTNGEIVPTSRRKKPEVEGYLKSH